MLIKEQEMRNRTMYSEQFAKNERKAKRQSEIKQCTAAGMPTEKEKRDGKKDVTLMQWIAAGVPIEKEQRITGNLVTPMDFDWLDIETKLKEAGFTKQNLEAAQKAYLEERALQQLANN